MGREDSYLKVYGDYHQDPFLPALPTSSKSLLRLAKSTLQIQFSTRRQLSSRDRSHSCRSGTVALSPLTALGGLLALEWRFSGCFLIPRQVCAERFALQQALYHARLSRILGLMGSKLCINIIP